MANLDEQLLQSSSRTPPCNRYVWRQMARTFLTRLVLYWRRRLLKTPSSQDAWLQVWTACPCLTQGSLSYWCPLSWRVRDAREVVGYWCCWLRTAMSCEFLWLSGDWGMSFSTQETSVGDETGTAMAEALWLNDMRHFLWAAGRTTIGDATGRSLAQAAKLGWHKLTQYDTI